MICPVCSDVTAESKACRACKSFYSRNKETASFPCILNTYECELTLQTRKTCRGCRLKKCHAAIASNKENNPVPILKRPSSAVREDEETKRARGLAIAERPGTPAAVGHRIGGMPLRLISTPPQQRRPAASADTTLQIQNAIEDAVVVLNQILPAAGSYMATVTSITDRPDVLTYAMNIAENHMTKWGQPFFTTHPGYQHHRRPQWLMCKGVFLCSILDMTWEILQGNVGYEYVLNDESERVTPMELAVFGSEAALPSYNQLLQLLRDNGFTHLDYCFYRQLAIYDARTMEKDEIFRDWNIKVLNAYQLARKPSKAQMDDVMETFLVFHTIANLNMSYCKRHKKPMRRESYPLLCMAISRAANDAELRRMEKTVGLAEDLLLTRNQRI